MTDSNSDNSDKTAVLSTDPATLRRDLQRARQSENCLIVVRGSHQGDRYFVTLPEMVLGRDPTVDISLSDPGASRKHAKLFRRGDRVLIADLGSSNGTFINDLKLAPGVEQELHKEDMVKIGNTILKYLPAGELEILAWENLHSQANTDPLTKIFNKGY
jgi:hypothetical protein